MKNIALSGTICNAEYLFITITYNHESYIIEHLESIRYQIEHWGDGRKCSILIADDCSRDDTVNIAKAWLEVHGDCFATYKILESEKNEGTCANYVRVFPYARGRRIKVLAGDDLYSSLNIFELIDRATEDVLVSGLPLMLYPEGLQLSKAQVFNIVASEEIYSRNFLGAMKGFSSIHTPSLAYDEGALNIPEMKEFISSFSVVEDFAMQIHLAEAKQNLQYTVDERFYIYYRRTHQSTYIIKNEAFIRDKTRMYRHLADKESNPIKQSLIRNRILCLRMTSIMKYIANANALIYALQVLIRLPRILFRLARINSDIESFKQHLLDIQKKAREFCYVKEVNKI